VPKDAWLPGVTARGDCGGWGDSGASLITSRIVEFAGGAWIGGLRRPATMGP
jgi:hypothetical protein